MDFGAKIFEVVLFMPGFLFSLAWHESAHGFVANLFGDPTAKNMGRVTLNPIPHMDMVGTLILPIIGVFTGFFFGWGVPVPVDYRNLKNIKRDGMIIALAGPVSNLILALLLSFVIKYLYTHQQTLIGATFQAHHLETVITTLVTYLFLNLGLCFFNLIPIQPLDGGKILYGILPKKIANQIDQFTVRYGFIILIVLFVTGLIRYILLPPILIAARWLLGGIM